MACDIFLSTSGEDSCWNFSNGLYTAFDEKGIRVCRDDLESLRGEFLVSAILRKSRLAIVVFSLNYASSTWCLDVLVKMLDCRTAGTLIIIPVFYGVDRDAVIGQFKVAFDEHKERFHTEKEQSWSKALSGVVHDSLWDGRDGSDPKLISDIVQYIMTTFFYSSGIRKYLVGMDSRLQNLERLIDERPNDVRRIGICGMVGSGKTALARKYYELKSREFGSHCFLDLATNDLDSSEKQLIPASTMSLMGRDWPEILRASNEPGLLVLDDVVNVDQFEKLLGSYHFAEGSRIIITSRDENLLKKLGVHDVYKVELLNDAEAHDLLELQAFKNRLPFVEYRRFFVIERVIKYASGLPFVLNLLGSYLFGRTANEWASLSISIDRHFEDKILYILKKSYDALEKTEKEIFLNIVSCFRGKDELYEREILDRFGFNATRVMNKLKDKSLITSLPGNKLSIHVWVQKMGQQILKKKSEKYERIRLLEEGLTKSMAISVALDQYGKSKSGFLLAAFLLSAFGFLTTTYACIKKRATLAFRLQAERQLAWVEFVFSVVQLVTTLVQFILSVKRVKSNFSASLLPLAFAILVTVFAFKEEKLVTTHARFSYSKVREGEAENLLSPV